LAFEPGVAIVFFLQLIALEGSAVRAIEDENALLHDGRQGGGAGVCWAWFGHGNAGLNDASPKLTKMTAVPVEGCGQQLEAN
jgi:hypothetical protein